jgi:hypothetical protein
MANGASWFMYFLGIAHIVFGLVRLGAPLADAAAAFAQSPFWAPLLVAPVVMVVVYQWLPL